MNEKITEGQAMILNGYDRRKVLGRIVDNALRTRSVKQVSYRPFLDCSGVGFTRTLGSQKVNLEIIYPRAEVGDGVIADFNIACEQDEIIYLNVTSNVKVWYEAVCIYDGIKGTVNTGEVIIGQEKEDWVHLPIRVRRDAENSVKILCVKDSAREFAYEFLISVKRYPFMWANDYLFAARAVLPVAQRAGEEGVALSGLLKQEEYEGADIEKLAIAYQWPPVLKEEEDFDFEKLYGEGDVSYVYTEVTEEHELQYKGAVTCIYINGKPCKLATDGLYVNKGDKILLRCDRGTAGWKLWLDTKHLTLSFLTSARGKGDKAICAGPFYGSQCHGPEYDWDFSKVFVNQRGQRVYWRFCDGSRLRVYLDSIFFGQWFYALMVGFYGIRDAAVFLGDTARQRLFGENMSMMAKYFDYIEYDIKEHVMPAFMPRLYEMNVLDNIGTMGMNLIDAYLDSNDRALLPLIDRIKYQMEVTVPRLEDGTFCRINTMWADDLYMSCPFLVRMGRFTGEVSWYQKAAEQIQGFKKRLYIEDEHLFSHIFFPDRERANKVPWGRGNGWVMWTLSELLMYGSDYVDLSEEKELFYEMAHGIRALQDESGLWHQVLNRSEEGSYLETSCTGMFLLAFTRGVKYGWLEPDFLDCMEKAWQGLLTYSIDKSGNVYGVCMGSGCAMEAEYYYTIPTIINDDHGTGVILAAGAEYCAFLESLK